MTDVCPFSLGVATYNHVNDRNPHMAFLIQRSTMLPASHQSSFRTLSDNQQSIRFEIYQGEGYYASENLKLGEITVMVPPAPAGKESATVTFTYDIDGILNVSVRSSGGDCRERMILNSRFRQSESAYQRAMDRIREIRLAAQGTQRERLLLERGLRLFQQAVGPLRDHISRLIEYTQTVLDTGGPIDRRRMCTAVQEELDRIEAALEEDPLAGNFWSAPEDEEYEEE